MEARTEYTNALRAWIASRGDDEPAAKARLIAARAAVQQANNPKETP